MEEEIHTLYELIYNESILIEILGQHINTLNEKINTLAEAFEVQNQVLINILEGEN